jgi:hypothetical protein
MITTQPTIQISTTLFWSVYNTLLTTEKALAELEDEKLYPNQIEAHKEVCHALGRLESVVSALKHIN